MDTVCKAHIPFSDLEVDMERDLAIFKPHLPTGITNDVMIATARHPAYKKALDRIPLFYKTYPLLGRAPALLQHHARGWTTVPYPRRQGIT